MTTSPAPLNVEDLVAKPYLVKPTPESRLEQLHAAYADAKAAADKANEELKAITDAIKLEVTQAAPGQERIDLRSPHGPALRLTYIQSRRMNSKAIKPVLDAAAAANPALADTFYTTSGAWKLQAVAGGGE